MMYTIERDWKDRTFTEILQAAFQGYRLGMMEKRTGHTLRLDMTDVCYKNSNGTCFPIPDLTPAQYERVHSLAVAASNSTVAWKYGYNVGYANGDKGVR